MEATRGNSRQRVRLDKSTRPKSGGGEWPNGPMFNRLGSPFLVLGRIRGFASIALWLMRKKSLFQNLSLFEIVELETLPMLLQEIVI